MLQLSPVVRRVLWGTATAFVLLVALRVHGFSLPIWHGWIDDSPRSEILLGEARSVRADDWALQLPLALALAQQRFPVIGFDRDTAKVEMLNAGRSYISHIGSEAVAAARGAQRFEATSACRSVRTD